MTHQSAEEKINWRCPKCQSVSLEVTVQVWATLTQQPDGNFETSVYGDDHGWDSDSAMLCNDCRHHGRAEEFETDDVATEDAEPTNEDEALFYHQNMEARCPPRE